MLPPLYLIGRFPPPIDGQAVLTRRLATLLGDAYTMHCIDLSPRDAGFVKSEVRFRPGRIWHYMRMRARVRAACATIPDAPILWTSISPATFGHLRDRLAILPAFSGPRSVYAVVHRGNFDEVFRKAVTARSAQKMVNRLRGIVFNNDELAEACAPWIPPAKRFVVPNTIDDEVRCTPGEVADKQAAFQHRTTRKLLFLSNMIPSKGYLDVLQAVGLLHQRGVPLSADFVGNWQNKQDRQAFERVVRMNRLEPIVTHHGGIADRSRVKALSLAADVFLLPTYYPTEAQPVSVLEALNSGTPVVATRHAGLPDMIGTEAGVFVPPRDPDAIARAVVQLTTPTQWGSYSVAARRRFEQHFSPEAVRRLWIDLLQQARHG